MYSSGAPATAFLCNYKCTLCTCMQDSAHFKNEQRKQAQVDHKIAQLQAQAAALLPSHLSSHQQ